MAVSLPAGRFSAQAAGRAALRFLARDPIEVHAARHSIERIGKLADGLVSFGPFGIGLDGLLTWIPFVGAAYSVGAGVALLALGARARVPLTVLVQVGAIVLARSGVGEVPLAGQIVVDLFRGHKWAADLLTRSIDQTLYIEGPKERDRPEYAEAVRAIREGREKRRIVFLG